MVLIATFVGCSKEDTEKEPVVTVQTAVAQKGSLMLSLGSKPFLSEEPGGHHSQDKRAGAPFLR